MDLKWKTFSNNAKNKNPKYIEPIIPFKEDVILSEFNPVYKNIYDKEKYLNNWEKSNEIFKKKTDKLKFNRRIN